ERLRTAHRQRALAGFGRSLLRPAQDHPPHPAVRTLSEKLQQGPARTNLDVIRVSADGEDSQRPVRDAGKGQAEHGSDGVPWLPDRPGQVALLVARLEIVEVLEGVHRCPEAVVLVANELSRFDQPA